VFKTLLLLTLSLSGGFHAGNGGVMRRSHAGKTGIWLRERGLLGVTLKRFTQGLASVAAIFAWPG
jgi:hypothetical protein